MTKTALITGASGGIGMELARQFAADNINLVLVARSMDKLDQLAAELQQDYGVTATIISLDLSEPDAARKVYDRLKTNGIQVDYLVNNAGFGHYGFFTEADWEKKEQMINLNIMALTHFCKLFIPDMKARGTGRIMNVASTAAFQPGPLMAVYFATKAYVLSFSEALANELRGTGVTMTALCPGATETGFEKAAEAGTSRLFHNKKLPGAAEVAAFGYKAMHRGKTLAIHGRLNKVLAFSNRFAPRKLSATVARKMMERA